ncbi:MAG: hypothetical protein KA392_05000 [Candidatus Obscuribacter sp.]|nr:hypothetical protein [Candidatus Obscuribacter sp.]MBP7576053.1 hypothetical protein [Candidatus Obscuribacter sp.]
MSQLDFVYGVFENAKDLQLIVADLHKAGFKEVEINVVGKDCPEFHHQSAKIKSPQAKYFVKYGIVGAFAGLWGGVMLAPPLHYVVTFQVMTMIMAAVSGGIVMAYIGTFLSAFLHASQPQYFANAYEGDVTNGAVLVSVECVSADERRKAYQIIDSHNPVETISRAAVVGPIIGLTPKAVSLVSESTVKLSEVA